MKILFLFCLLTVHAVRCYCVCTVINSARHSKAICFGHTQCNPATGLCHLLTMSEQYLEGYAKM